MVKIIIWAIPRSVSTAFEKAFIQNDKVKVMHEPFSIPYYFGKEKKSDRYLDQHNKKTFIDVYKKIINDDSNILVIKDMAYYVDDFIDTSEGQHLIDVCEHAFLFRDPEKSVYSLYKGSFNEETGWNSFDESEIGYTSLKKVYEKCIKRDKNVMMIESDVFLKNPEKTILDFCTRYNIDYTEKMLVLEKVLPEWKVWEPWHKDAIDNKKFLMSSIKEYDNDIMKKVEPYIKKNDEYYKYFKNIIDKKE